MKIEYRVLTDTQEMGEACQVFWRAMVGLPPLGDIDPVPGLEPGRFIGAFHDGRVVGCLDSYRSWLTVPGGARIPSSAMTHLGVLPTHTRQGIMRELAVRQFTDSLRRGEIVGAMCPAEAHLHEKFGWAPATSAVSARLHRSGARLRAPDHGRHEIRLVDQPDARNVLSAIYEPIRWNGSIKRPDGWWLLHHLAQAAEPIKPYRAVHGRPGAEDGFVDYRPTNPDEWMHGYERRIVVDDFVALSRDAYHGLLQHLLSLDLVNLIDFHSLPADDPLPELFTDRRVVRDVQLRDELWIRLLDVAAALSARTFRPTGSVVLEVLDPLFDFNNGCYDVSGDGVVRTTAPPGIRVDVAGLASAYLGGTKWWQLVASRRAEELIPGAVEAADDLFAVATLPYCGTSF
ncbi:GNAT family N-acetyltransferase [Micromonospora sp. NPDC051141]|uniref:GNAT family N-acetyltransferase n=1 Tax=Micromonospora sp. NPDC051141 TaxID=3364284 RepID=UPI00378DC8F2